MLWYSMTKGKSHDNDQVPLFSGIIIIDNDCARNKK